MATWDAAAYARFEAERGRPAEDLIARAPSRRYGCIADLGCGAALSTVVLARRFPDADIVGIDTSPSMLSAAREKMPEARFERGDIATWSDRSVELVFSNAALHWVPNHISVMARLASELPERGCLAVQFPDNLAEPSHALMREIAAAPRFRAKLAQESEGREAIGDFADYDAQLSPHCRHIDIWRTVYVHRLESPDAIVAWVEGAGLRPFLEPLAADERAEYLALYRDGVAKAYPSQPWGGVLLPFPRLFVVAARG